MHIRSAAVLALAAIFVVAGCQPAAQPTPTPGGPDGTPGADIQIGVVTDIGRLEDASFNQYSNQGAVDAAQELGVLHRVIVTQELADHEANINSLIDAGFNVIVTIGFLAGDATLAAAQAHPDVTFIGVDQFIGADPAPENYQGILFDEAQSGYLAGIIAAHITESNVIGSVRGTDVPPVVSFWEGYENGARSVNPDIQTLSVESDSDPNIGFNDPGRGREIATQMIDQGADVIFQIAGETGRGAVEAACDRGIWAIGVDVDQSQSLPQLAGCIVTSAEKKLQQTVHQVLISVADGTFQSGNQFYTASSDPPGIGYSDFHDHSDLLTAELQAALDEAFAAMAAGTLDPRATPAP